MTPAQRLMVKDGLPPAAFLTEYDRRLAWLANPPRPMPLFQDKTRDEDPATAEFRAQMEAERRQKSLNQIAKMKTRFAAKAIDYKTMRWDARRAKFVPISAAFGAKLAPAATATPYEPAGVPDRKVANAGASPTVADVATGLKVVTKNNAEAIARLNGVWKDSYAGLRGTGRIVMTVRNRLRGLKEEIKWA